MGEEKKEGEVDIYRDTPVRYPIRVKISDVDPDLHYRKTPGSGSRRHMYPKKRRFFLPRKVAKHDATLNLIFFCFVV